MVTRPPSARRGRRAAGARRTGGARAALQLRVVPGCSRNPDQLSVDICLESSRFVQTRPDCPVCRPLHFRACKSDCNSLRHFRHDARRPPESSDRLRAQNAEVAPCRRTCRRLLGVAAEPAPPGHRSAFAGVACAPPPGRQLRCHCGSADQCSPWRRLQAPFHGHRYSAALVLCLLVRPHPRSRAYLSLAHALTRPHHHPRCHTGTCSTTSTRLTVA